MATYLILNIVFGLSLFLLKPRFEKPPKYWVAMLVVLLLLTALFDSLLVGFEIVGYNQAKILGLYVGRAPIEDFFYSVYAACLLPLVWRKVGNSHAKR